MQCLALAEKEGAIVPLMAAHCLMGLSLLCTGDAAEGRAHFDRTIALTENRPPETRRGQGTHVTALFMRSIALWFLGNPKAARRGPSAPECAGVW